jgi:hypothetical protein
VLVLAEAAPGRVEVEPEWAEAVREWVEAAVFQVLVVIAEKAVAGAIEAVGDIEAAGVFVEFEASGGKFHHQWPQGIILLLVLLPLEIIHQEIPLAVEPREILLAVGLLETLRGKLQLGLGQPIASGVALSIVAARFGPIAVLFPIGLEVLPMATPKAGQPVEDFGLGL